MDTSRQMDMTKLMLFPLRKMQERVMLLIYLAGQDIVDDIKYVMNSAHDD